MLRVGSLFSGIGGFDLAFEWAGARIAWQVEIDPFCQAVLRKHWPDVEQFSDVREIYGGRHRLPPVDILCGGFPCQPVSLAGKQLAQADERWLWPEVARLVRELRPRGVALENVPGLLVHGLGDVLGDLAAAGYDAEWTSLRAADVGAPHKRQRVYIVAWQRELADADRGRRERLGEPQPAGIEGARWRQSDGRSDGGEQFDAADGGLAHPEQSRLEGAIGAVVAGSRDGRQDGDAAGPVADARRSRGRPEWRGDTESLAYAASLRGSGGDVEAELHAARYGSAWHGWPARPGEPQQGWEAPRVLRRVESGVGVYPDGLPTGMVRHRRRVLAALGNSIVPQVAFFAAQRLLWRLQNSGIADTV